jgi:hypothetical protein
MSSRWRLWVALGCAGAAALSACDDAATREAQQRKHDLATLVPLWGPLSRCLVGPPLAEGEKASARMRLSELGLLAQPRKKRGDWPKGCIDLAKPLRERLGALESDAGHDDVQRLKQTLDELASAGPAMYLADKESPLIDRLFDAARALGLGVEPEDMPANATLAPAPQKPLDRQLLALLGTSQGFVERVELAPSESVGFMIGSGDDKSFQCRISSAKAPLDSASCKEASRKLGIVATPLSREGEGDELYFDRGPEPAVWTPSGESQPGPYSASAFVFADGTLADVTKGDKGFTMVRQHPGRRPETAPLRQPPAARWLGFRAGTILWRGPIIGPLGQSRLKLQEVQPGRVGLSGEIELSEVPKDVAEIEACRSGDTLAVALVGEDPKPINPKDKADPPRTVAMVFRSGAERKWHKSGFAAVRFGAEPHPWELGWWRAMSCDERGASFAWLRPDRRIGLVRCDKEGAGDGCKSSMSEPIGALDDSEKLRLAVFGDKVLVVRVQRTIAPLSGVSDVLSMRFGPLGTLHKAREQVLLGDDDHGGLDNLHKSLGLVATGGAAVILVHAGDRIHGLRIDASGRPSKLGLR